MFNFNSSLETLFDFSSFKVSQNHNSGCKLLLIITAERTAVSRDACHFADKAGLIRTKDTGILLNFTVTDMSDFFKCTSEAKPFVY